MSIRNEISSSPARPVRPHATAVRYACYALSVLLVASYGWLRSVFGNRLTVEQIFFHFDLGLNSLTGVDLYLILDALQWVVLPTLAITTVLYLAGILTERVTTAAAMERLLSLRGFRLAGRIIGKCYLSLTSLAFSLFLALFTTVLFLYQIELFHFVRISLGEDKFSALYQAPEIESLAAGPAKKNLLLIYVESLERTMGNAGLVGRDAIAPIRQLDGTEIPTFPAAPGTNWTIAGMFASQCSVPLKPFFANKFHSFATEDFLPGAVCLGDVLNAAGYEQYFLVGHHLAYSGLDKFYRTHGYHHLLGREEWKQRGVDASEFTSWGFGLHDDMLLEQARIVLREHDGKRAPFNLTLITQDNHFPRGIPSPRCRDDEKQGGFAGAFHCNSRFLANFVTHLKKEGLLDNTVVVLMGDHPFMNSMKQSLQFRGERHVYFKILSPLTRQPARSTLTHFDVAPSLLDLLGLTDGKDTRFGLGISLFSGISAEDYAQHLKAVTSDSILNKSMTYEAFWKPKAASAESFRQTSASPPAPSGKTQD